MHLPAENALIAAGLHSPTSVAILAQEHAVITCGPLPNANFGSLCLINVKKALRSSKELESDGSGESTEMLAHVAKSRTKSIELLVLGNSVPLVQPHAIAVVAHIGTLAAVVTDRSNATVHLVRFRGAAGGTLSGVSERLDKLPEEAEGRIGAVAVLSSSMTQLVLVCVKGSTVYELRVQLFSDPSKRAVTFTTQICNLGGEELHGVAKLSCSEIVVTSNTGKIFRVTKAQDHWTFIHVAGSGLTADDENQDGRAQMVAFTQPKFACSIGKSVVIADTGAGRLRLLTDLHPYATKLLPAMCDVANVFSLPQDNVNDHADGLVIGAALSQRASCFFDDAVDANAALTGRSGGQGDAGNSSRPLRSALRLRPRALHRLLARLAWLKVPEQVVRHIRMIAFTSLVNESWFSRMRERVRLPYEAQYVQSRERVAIENAKERQGDLLGFSYTVTASQRKHYGVKGAAGLRAAALVVFRAKKPKKSAELSEQDRAIIAKAAKRLRGARQLAPTDRSRAPPGAAPPVYWAAAGASSRDGVDARTMLPASSNEFAPRAATKGKFLYKIGDLVLVLLRSSGGLRLAVLQEAVMTVAKGARGQLQMQPATLKMILLSVEGDEADAADDAPVVCSHMNGRAVQLAATSIQVRSQL